MRTRFIESQEEIDAIIAKCDVCYVGMTDPDGIPYVLPFNFGYRDGIIYLHSAGHGRKIDILRQNPSVCIVFSTDHKLNFQSEQVACSYSMHYRSVQAFGKVEFVDETEEKVAILNIVMSNYTEKVFSYNPPSLKEVCTYKIAVERFSGKVFGYRD